MRQFYIWRIDMKVNLFKKTVGLFLAMAVMLSAVPFASAAAEIKAAGNKSINVMDLELAVTGQKEFLKNKGMGSRDTRLSVGDQAVTSRNGFVIRPDSKGAKPNVADVNIDLTKLDTEVTYFSAIVGNDDNSPIIRAYGVNGSAQCIILADGKTLTDTATITPGDMYRVGCVIPAGTKTLTLRTTDVEGDNYLDYCDWIEPTLYEKAPSAGVIKDLYTDYNATPNTVLSAEGAIGVRFNVKEAFSEITVKKEFSETDVVGSLYEFKYSYGRSLQNKPVATITEPDVDGSSLTFNFESIVPAGEYIFVVDGLKNIKVNSSAFGYCYADGNASVGLVNMSIKFVDQVEDYLATPSDEPFFTKKTTAVSGVEKQRAQDTYNNLINNLADFPSSVNIGEDSYSGFPTPDFTVKSKDTADDELHHCITNDITLKHKSGLEFILKTAFYYDYAALEWTVYVTNAASENSPIVSNFYGCKDYKFVGSDPTILTNNSDFESSEAPYRTDTITISDGETITDSPYNGRSSDEAFPYYNFEYGDKGALIAVGWSSTWQTDFTYKDGVTTFSDKQKVFSSYIKPGEVARTPLTAMVLYDGRDKDRATNLWRNWFIDCNMYRDNGKDLVDPFVAGVTSIKYNEMLNANTENQKESIKAYVDANVDIDVWWMDAGWYPCNEPGSTNRDWRNTGNWTPDTERFPDKFKEISEYANQNDIKTLLWFEPERVGMVYTDGQALDDSCVKREWLIGYGEENESAYEERYYRQLDIGNDECREWLKSQVAKVLTEGGISIYREDLNIGRSETNYNLYNAAHPDRTGITENKCVQGHYDYWKYLIGLDQVELLDSCASGGHRLDIESMRLAVSLHPSDYNHNDMIAKQVANYNLCSWIPFVGANSAENRTMVDEYTLRSAYRPALVLQYDPPSQQTDKLNRLLTEWRGISKYFYDDIYQFTYETYSRNELYSYGYIDREAQEGYAMVYNRNEVEKNRFIKLKGLNEDDTYEITFASGAAAVTATGTYLMNRGVKVKVKSSDILYIKRTNTAATDLAAFNKALENCKNVKVNVMTIESAFRILKAISNAEMIQQAGDAAKPINFVIATEQLNKAKKAQKIASPSEPADQKNAQLSAVIDYIGEVTVDNFRQKIYFIEFAETAKAAILKKYPDTVILKDDVLLAARAKYDELTAEPADDIMYGDVDANGTVEATDALWALQAYVGSRQLDDIAFKAADVNLDEKVDTSDALAILQYAVKLRDKLPIA